MQINIILRKGFNAVLPLKIHKFNVDIYWEIENRIFVTGSF